MAALILQMLTLVSLHPIAFATTCESGAASCVVTRGEWESQEVAELRGRDTNLLQVMATAGIEVEPAPTEAASYDCPPRYPKCGAYGQCFIIGATPPWANTKAPNVDTDPTQGNYTRIDGYDAAGTDCTSDYPDYQAQYMLMGNGTTTCVGGYVPVTTSQACTKAGQSMMYTWNQEGSWRALTRGCGVMKGMYIYFNTHPEGQAHHDEQPLCMQATPTPTAEPTPQPTAEPTPDPTLAPNPNPTEAKWSIESQTDDIGIDTNGDGVADVHVKGLDADVENAVAKMREAGLIEATN